MAPAYGNDPQRLKDRHGQQRKSQRLLSQTKAHLETILNRYATAVWGQGLNARSTKQLQDFFYGTLRIPAIKSYKGKSYSNTVNAEALEKLQAYLYAQPFAKLIIEIRNIGKKLDVLQTNIDSDNRFRAQFNSAGTNTGRLSSSKNQWGTGSNMQNITDEMRVIVVADEGYKLAYIDLDQAESIAVGALCCVKSQNAIEPYRDADSYLLACESGDLHTFVTKKIWPDLEWTGDNNKDRAIAEQLYHRKFSYRDMAKRGGHGTNYGGQAPHMAKQIHVPLTLMEQFQLSYFSEFSCIKIGMGRWLESYKPKEF